MPMPGAGPGLLSLTEMPASCFGMERLLALRWKGNWKTPPEADWPWVVLSPLVLA